LILEKIITIKYLKLFELNTHFSIIIVRKKYPKFLYGKNYKNHSQKNESGSNVFVMNASKWINATNAIGLISKRCQIVTN